MSPLWSPSADTVESSRLTAFARWVGQRLAIDFPDYDALHRWSIENPGEFWQLFWTHANTISSTLADAPVVDLHKFPGARWFPGAELNFAENLLRERSDRIAFISLLENGERREMTYNEVYNETAAIATQLRALGIEPGDRIAGWLPNVPQTAIAMLAASSLGAVWSSCSPDFGTEGALDRFGQIEPRVLFACDGYYYGGKVLDVRDKVREVADAVPSIERIVWVDVLGYDIGDMSERDALWSDWHAAESERLTFAQLPFDHPLYIMYSPAPRVSPSASCTARAARCCST